ncbi:hypothetical protein K440DRAFT_645226 [Wilcoxina mikolae CBS 423.85]|nr:hypothetical protein K440DRAFT_645226 [Wilcoxina mikolae CBS 423.85]
MRDIWMLRRKNISMGMREVIVSSRIATTILVLDATHGHRYVVEEFELQNTGYSPFVDTALDAWRLKSHDLNTQRKQPTFSSILYKNNVLVPSSAASSRPLTPSPDPRDHGAPPSSAVVHLVLVNKSPLDTSSLFYVLQRRELAERWGRTDTEHKLRGKLEEADKLSEGQVPEQSAGAMVAARETSQIEKIRSETELNECANAECTIAMARIRRLMNVTTKTRRYYQRIEVGVLDVRQVLKEVDRYFGFRISFAQ